VSLSPEEQPRFIGKTGIPTQNVLAICDFDMKFTYVAAGQPGAYHDTNVLYHAMEVDAQIFPHPPEGKNIHYLLSSPFYSSNYYAIFICAGKYYVVDASYPNRPGYLSPYKGKRYHLPEWHRGTESNTPN
jgi:hypothetical protein